jgi:hypothetical protein
VLVAIVVMWIAGGSLLAQGVLMQLGLTESAAREFVIDEVKGPAGDRRAAIVVAGTRGFVNLPRAARGPAATALFAWAKGYVNSASFKTAYDTFRKGTIPEVQQYDLTVEQEVKRRIDELLAQFAAMRQNVASMPPAEAAKILEAIKQQEAEARNPAYAETIRAGLQAERATTRVRGNAALRNANDRYPADLQRFVARRLREFLDGTANVDFSARTISLSGGADGIEFTTPADRKNPWLWQEAVIVGEEATTAARAAAAAWLKEIER